MNRPAILLAIAALLGLAGCAHEYATQDDLACDRMMDWNDRKACKQKVDVQRTEWEKRKG